MTSQSGAARKLRPQALGRYLLVCDHATNFVPPELGNLGLAAAALAEHIAWDIGAAGVTEALSETLNSPAVLCTTSRLVIDCNRQLTATDLIPDISHGTAIPANANLSNADRYARIDRWFHPYHDAIESALEERLGKGLETTVISIHSMTPSLAGSSRPWQIALSSYTDRRLTDPVLAALRMQKDIVVGDNQPYDLDPAVDYTIPFHALRRNLHHIQVEFRQDEIAEPAGQLKWADRLARALAGSE